jgi:hypothetical protein
MLKSPDRSPECCQSASGVPSLAERITELASADERQGDAEGESASQGTARAHHAENQGEASRDDAKSQTLQSRTSGPIS